jgi:hypothetical protein
MANVGAQSVKVDECLEEDLLLERVRKGKVACVLN